MPHIIQIEATLETKLHKLKKKDNSLYQRVIHKIIEISKKGLRRLLDTFSFCEFPEQFEEYLRVQPEPPVNNTVLFVTKEVC